MLIVSRRDLSAARCLLAQRKAMGTFSAYAALARLCRRCRIETWYPFYSSSATSGTAHNPVEHADLQDFDEGIVLDLIRVVN